MNKINKPPVTHTPLMLGNIAVTQGPETQSRMAILLWGQSTAGKTTFAATAPGTKLWISFGDNEHVSVQHRADVTVANVSGMSINELFKQAQGENPFGLDQYLSSNTDVETVVVDSATALVARALDKAIADNVGAGKGFTPSVMAPGIAAYGGRNGVTLEILANILRVTSKHGVHCIITAHEDDPTMRMESDGGKAREVIDYIGVMLGGKIVNGVTWRLSEIWNIRQDRDESRYLAVRPVRLRKPMKTRMFMPGTKEFELHYDAERPDTGQDTIAKWHKQWADGGYQRIEAPSAVTHTTKSKR